MSRWRISKARRSSPSGPPTARRRGSSRGPGCRRRAGAGSGTAFDRPRRLARGDVRPRARRSRAVRARADRRPRSEERRVGKEGVSTVRTRVATDHEHKKTQLVNTYDEDIVSRRSTLANTLTRKMLYA